MIVDFPWFRFRIRRPIIFLRRENYELTFKLSESAKNHSIVVPMGYQIRRYSELDNVEIVELLRSCGFHFSDEALGEAINICIPDGIHLIEQVSTKRLVSMMMSRHLSSSEFPFGGRIDWLATDPNHRGMGLGTIVAALATNLLVDRKYKNIWVTTQTSRPGAIKIFTSLGFVPTDKTLFECSWQEIKKTIKEALHSPTNQGWRR